MNGRKRKKEKEIRICGLWTERSSGCFGYVSKAVFVPGNLFLIVLF